MSVQVMSFQVMPLQIPCIWLSAKSHLLSIRLLNNEIKFKMFPSTKYLLMLWCHTMQITDIDIFP